jgi:type II secretory pathway pseudopilin PulG
MLKRQQVLQIVQAQKGQSLVQLLVTIGIMGVVMAALASMNSNMSRENRALGEQMASFDLARIVSTTLALPAGCDSLITKPNNLSAGSTFTFTDAPATYPFIINLNSVPQSATIDIVSLAKPQASPLSSSLQIKPVGGIQIVLTSATTGSLQIHFDQNRLVRAIHDLEFPIAISTTPSGGNKTVGGCTSVGSTPPPATGKSCGSILHGTAIFQGACTCYMAQCQDGSINCVIPASCP